MGALVGSVCYGTIEEAAGALAAQTPVVSSFAGSALVTYQLEYDAGLQWVRYVDGVQDVATPWSASFVSCDPVAQVADGAQLAFAVGLCWIAAWAFVMLKRAAR